MIDGLYVHVPFCQHVCAYCDFAKARYIPSLADRYLTALDGELMKLTQKEFETLYVGGGTPTALDDERLERLLSMLDRFLVHGEYTIEVNPETFSASKAAIFKHHGVNRVSLGVESFSEKVLAAMDRVHHNIDVHNCFRWLKDVGIANISIDLMYGFAEQTLGDFIHDLDLAVSMPVTHISVYDLEVYDATPLGMSGYRKIDDETDYLMYKQAIEYLNSHSYRQYEVSNFAFSHYQSQHNLIYWHYGNFYGAGLGASGKIDGLRYDNTRNFARYFAGRLVDKEYHLTARDQQFEALMMGLRLVSGIDVPAYDRRFGCDMLFQYRQAIEANMAKGLLVLDDGWLHVTEKGMFLLNDVLVDFMD